MHSFLVILGDVGRVVLTIAGLGLVIYLRSPGAFLLDRKDEKADIQTLFEGKK